ncbi:DUF72 domain-containing protein [Mucilaginibacter pallidiroseus]|uniref:DUF72 domain-containing protein n=1 Tax=Mucilaginibacter pallidiroseus TaxID=2599295 RepID=A0A563U390_9SPHI|nr:DUF72 domain-containing protein [Mucilaginibacter pallidiroseus]TWR25819.1 DUF72 domain-containing protein [Mucilaginibacter pallidiroseus]
MEFGRVAETELDLIDYTLPPTPAFTKDVLNAAAPTQELAVHAGCAKWGRKEWVGKIYPLKTKDANFLDEYVKHFNCIELNATFYQVYGPQTIAKWKEKADANPEFRFCPKFSQSISHIRRLKNAEEITTQYYEGIMAFGDKLGPLFLQLSDNFGPKNLPELTAYLEHLPTDVLVFVELRHKDWFSVTEHREAAFNLFKRLNIGSIITDASGRRDCLHMMLPTPHAFIRFVGNSLHRTDYTRCDEWVDRIVQWKEEGLKSVYFFMHQHDERYSPELCDYVINKLNTRLGLSIPRPQFINKDKGLFD